jgi:hypothetical protein
MLEPMKQASWVFVGVLGLAIAPAGCFSSTATPPEGTDSGPLSQDDGGQPAIDATTPNSDGGTPPVDAGVDSPAVDAGADTAVVDAGPQPLTLTVLRLGSPEPGVNVVFQDDTGAVVTTAVTDTAGMVTQIVTPGSQVTALLGTVTTPNPVTIQGVAPGDTLTVVDTVTAPSEGTENVTVTLPAPTWDASGVYEEAYAGSCYDPVSYPIYLGANCETAGQFPLLALAIETSTQQEIAYTYQLGNVAQPEGGLPDGDTSLPITVSLPWMTSTATATLSATNPPGLPGDGGTTSTANGVTFNYYEAAEGLFTSVPSPAGTTFDDAGTQSAAFAMHTGYPDFVQAEAVDTIRTPNDRYLVAAGATRAAPQATSLATSFDLSTLPLITATSLATADGGATQTLNVTWTSTGSLAAANGIYVSAQWSSSMTTDAGTVYMNGTWTILAPPTATNVQAPALPAEFAAWGPSPTAYVNATPRMAAVQASFVSGYAGFRAAFGAVSFLSGFEITVPTLPVNGTVYVVGFYPDEG